MKFGRIAIVVVGAVGFAAAMGSSIIRSNMNDRIQLAAQLYDTESRKMNRYIPASVGSCLAGQVASNFPGEEEFEAPEFMRRFYTDQTRFLYRTVRSDTADWKAALNKFPQKEEAKFLQNMERQPSLKQNKIVTIVESINSKPTNFFGCISRYTLKRVNDNI